MNKEFVPYQEALALKELGYNEDGLRFYIDGELCESPITQEQLTQMREASITKLRGTCLVVAPLWQQAFEFCFKKLNKPSGVMPILNKDKRLFALQCLIGEIK